MKIKIKPLSLTIHGWPYKPTFSVCEIDLSNKYIDSGTFGSTFAISRKDIENDYIIIDTEKYYNRYTLTGDYAVGLKGSKIIELHEEYQKNKKPISF